MIDVVREKTYWCELQHDPVRFWVGKNKHTVFLKTNKCFY